MEKQLIAPCGMNCAICLGYQREKNKCPGCRNLIGSKLKTRQKCVIRNCIILKENKWKFCSDKCEKYPCQRLKSLDKRYRTKYGMSMVENLEFIRDKGIEKFLEWEKKRWKCPKCGGNICVHRGICFKWFIVFSWNNDWYYRSIFSWIECY